MSQTNLISLPFKTTKPVRSLALLLAIRPDRQVVQIPDAAQLLVASITEADPDTHPDAVQPDAEGLAELRKKVLGEGEAPEADEAKVVDLMQCVILPLCCSGVRAKARMGATGTMLSFRML